MQDGWNESGKTSERIGFEATLSSDSIGFRGILYFTSSDILVSVTDESIKIAEGNATNFDSLFTVITSDGNTTDVTQKYILDGVETTEINTSNLPIGEHTLTCIATHNGDTSMATIIIVVALGFTLTFIANGSVFSTITETKTVSFPEENPTLTAREFTGWYYDKTTTQQANVSDSVTQDVNLYAGWTTYLTNKNYGQTTIETYWSIFPGGSASDETVFTYESNYEIDYIELDSENTTAIIRHYTWGRDWIDYDVSNYVYFDGNKIKLNTSVLTENVNSSAAGYAIFEGLVGVKIHFKDGSMETDVVDIYAENNWSCLAEGTQITLADHTTKAIEDIEYDDELLVWDFDNARFATAKPLWIKKLEIAHQYNLLKFDNGSELKTIDQHRIFNKELGKFSYPMTDETPVGTTTFTDSGEETKLVSKEIVEESVVYYNVITDYHMNLFANGILTSCRFSNLYPIENMKYIKDNRKLVPREEYPNVPDKYYHGLRLAEQPKEANRGNDVHHAKSVEEHIQNVYIANDKTKYDGQA